jgi:glycosyltransferase involved in cell wall biosynthesis
VTFTGFLNQSEISQAYVAADCLVLPSDEGETWGLVVNEALACGLPAIVSDRCGCAEDLALPLGEEYVYQCGDIMELASRLSQQISLVIIERADKITRLATLFHLDRTVDTIETLYNQSAGNTPI